MKVLLSLFLLLSLIACSGSKSTNDVEGENAGVEMAEGDEFEDDFSDDFSDDATPAGDEFAEETTPTDGLGEEPVGASEDLVEAEQTDLAPEPASPVELSNTGSNGEYTVKANDTLMLIAFKIYGDYDKWRDIARVNGDKLGSSYKLEQGMTLKYEEPAVQFVWNPNGNPYLIKRGDTLGTISNTTYGTQKHWRDIWNNNKPMIKDPNRIFAGFTLYTPIMESRDVANTDL